MFFISKNQYKLIQFYMKWPPFDFKHFCILSGIESIKFKHESWPIPLHSSSSCWRSSIIEYMGLAANFLSKMEHNISIGLRSRLFVGHSNRSTSILPFFLRRVLMYAKFPDLVGTCTRTYSVIFPLIVSILVAENYNTTFYS